MTVKMRRLLVCSALALVLMFSFVVAAQAATVTVSKVVVVVKGVYTGTPIELKNLTITHDVLDSTEPTTTVDTKKIGTKNSAWVTYIAKKSKRTAKNMAYVYKNKKMVIRNATTGYSISNATIYNAVLNALKAAPLDGSSVTVTVSPTLTKAGVTSRSKLGKCIVVDKSQRRLWLYNHGKKVLSYRVTIGMPGHSTPSGTYKIGTKRPHPIWSNPGSAWASRMPSVIKAGPSNPLGLRAMNLNRNGHDTGLRIHGTSNYRQIGTASSHGCIRVANKNIVKLYPKVPSGTIVIVQP